MRLVFLDSGTLGLLARQRGKLRPDQCRQWVDDPLTAGARVVVPEIADYEVRRKLHHIGAHASIARLDRLRSTLEYVPITTDAMRLAADLWARLRRAGLPTAAPGSLDGDCILAAQALSAAGPDVTLTIATDNVGHLGRLADARPWESVTG